MSLTRREWDAVVLMGCLAGTGIVCMFWIVTLALAELNRAMPGAGWAAAVVLVCGTAYKLWYLERATHPRLKTKGARDANDTNDDVRDAR